MPDPTPFALADCAGKPVPELLPFVEVCELVLEVPARSADVAVVMREVILEPTLFTGKFAPVVSVLEAAAPVLVVWAGTFEVTEV